MQRSTFLKGAALAAAAPPLLLAARRKERVFSDAAEGPGVKPSIFLTITDDQPFATVEHMVNVKNRIGAVGATFSRAWASVPLCDPSRCGILLGKHLHNHNMPHNDPPGGGMGVFRSHGWGGHTFLKHAQDAGYEVGYFGKTLHHDPGHTPEGVDSAYTFVGSPISPEHFDVYNSGDDKVRRIPRHNADGTENWDDTDLVARRCEEWVRSRWGSGKPLLVVFAPFSPHGPYGDAYVPKRVEGLFEGAARPPGPYNDSPEHYASTARDQDDAKNREEYQDKRKEIKVADDAVGRILDALEQAGRGEAYSFFTTDQPYMLGEHGLAKKERFYDHSSKVPLIVRGPGVAAQTADAFASNVDLYPTILDIAGADPALIAESDGRSLLPVLSGGVPDGWRKRVLVEQDATNPFRMIREDRYCYVEFPDGDKLAYDMIEDPDQTTNIYEALDASEKTRLTNALAAFSGSTGESARAAETT